MPLPVTLLGPDLRIASQQKCDRGQRNCPIGAKSDASHRQVSPLWQLFV